MDIDYVHTEPCADRSKAIPKKTIIENKKASRKKDLWSAAIQGVPKISRINPR